MDNIACVIKRKRKEEELLSTVKISDAKQQGPNF